MRLRALPLCAALAWLFVATLACGCGEPTGGDAGGAGPAGGGNGGKARPPRVPPTTTAWPTFEDVAPATGLDVTNHTGKALDKDWIVSAMGGGSIVLDYDSDGDVDLLVVDGTMITSEGVLEYDPAWRTRLFRNDGGMKFTDVTAQSGIDVQGMGFGGASCDYDADGHPDVYVCLWGRNFLYRNLGDGTFEDVTVRCGVGGDPGDMSTACAWGDLNGDGIHDLYVSNYVDQARQIREFRDHKDPQGNPDPKAGRSCNWRTFSVYCGPPGLAAQPDRLYFGTPDGKFTEVTDTHLDLGPDPSLRWHFAFQPVMTDVDGDGDLDIYVANDTDPNYLWVNDGVGNMKERATEAGCAISGTAAKQAGMGVDAADFNRDGFLDLTVTNFSHDYNTVYVNRTRRKDVPSFDDATAPLQVARLSHFRLCWGTRFSDFDNDGELDLFAAAGHVYGEIEGFSATGTTFRQRNLILRNMGPPRYTFEDATDASGAAFRIERVWRGAVFADFDDDGDMDVFVSALNDRAALFRNDGGNRNAFLRFRLVGKGGQRDPSGAWVTVHTPDGRALLEELHHGASFCSDNDPRLHFGLGGLDRVPLVEIRWPDGTTQQFRDVETRRLYVAEQGVPDLRAD